MAITMLTHMRAWLEALFSGCGDAVIYGFAELSPGLPQTSRHMPRAISFAVRMADPLMDSVSHGPTAAYYLEYMRVNQLLNDLGDAIAAKIEETGHRAERIHSSQVIDRVNLAGIFPHKTAAVIAGYGWIGRNCQLITRRFGPRVRLGTVVTDMMAGEPPVPRMRSYCGSCMRCVTSCPPGALTGEIWTEHAPRSTLLDAAACSGFLHENYPEFNSICGICTSVCPQGTERKKKKTA